MLDVTFIREHVDLVKEGMKNKGEPDSSIVDRVIEKDEEWRSVVTELDNLRAESNKKASKIGQLMGQGKKEEAQNELDYLLNSLEEQRSSEGDDASSIDHHMSDVGSIEESLDLTNRLIERNRKFINQLNRALERIENGTYGICRATGQPIEKERLEFAPHTRYSIAAKNSGLDKRVVMS